MRETRAVAVDASGLAPANLGEVGVALLGHDAATCGVLVGEGDEGEFLGGPQDKLFAESGQVHHADGGGGVEFKKEVAVGDGVHAVGADTVEA